MAHIGRCFSTEIRRLKAALGYSRAGLKAAWGEASFRCECVVAVILAPLAFVVTPYAMQRGLLVASLLFVLVVELLNSAIERVVDRISTERHPLSKQAKDIGSAAVLLSIVMAAVLWVSVWFA